jgi:cobalt-zinc-cadmium efflux system outer membrane protein
MENPSLCSGDLWLWPSQNPSKIHAPHPLPSPSSGSRVSVPVPLIDRSKGRKQEAQANTATAEAELAATEQWLLREWGSASQRMRTAAEQAARYRERILPKAKEALRLVQRGFEEGKFGFIDLLDTQRTAAEARLAYHQKLLELNIAQADIEALLARVPGEADAAYGPKTQAK